MESRSGYDIFKARLNLRAPLLWLLAPVIWGYIIGHFMPELHPATMGAPGLLIALATLPFAASNRLFARRVWPTLFLIAGTLLAASYYLQRLEPPPTEWNELPPREAELTLRVERLFQQSDRYGRVTGLARVQEAAPHLRDLAGHRIYFQLSPGRDELSAVRSSIILSRGTLRYLDPSQIESGFERFLVNSGAYFELKRGIILQTLHGGSWFQRFCSRQSAVFEQILKSGNAEDAALGNIYVAMLLGKKSVLESEQKSAFTASGTMHIFAISGLHVGVMAITLFYFFLLLRMPRKPSTLVSLAVLFLYVQITGASPSATRAFLMVVFLLGSKVFLRQSSPFASLILSALVVLLWDPLQLWSAGFQLSYAVVASILLYGLPLMEKLEGWRVISGELPARNRWESAGRELKRKLVQLFSISFSATLVSSPLVIHYFQVFTPGAVILNMALMPLASLAIISGFISLLFGLLQLVRVSVFFNHGAWVLIWVMENLITGFLKIPGLFWKTSFRWESLGIVAVLALLVALLAARSRRLVNSRIAYWIAPLILIIFIVFGTHLP